MVDHLVYSVRDLELGMNEIEALTGVRPEIGGQHPWGTWNALLALGKTTYLEIIAPDPRQAPASGPRIFQLNTLTESKLTRWAAPATDIPALVQQATANGIDLGEVIDGYRERPDGTPLRWSLTDPLADPGAGLIPFLIDWKDTLHPARTSPAGCRLLKLVGRHPKPELLKEQLRQLGIEFTVELGAEPALVATLKTPKGIIELS